MAGGLPGLLGKEAKELRLAVQQGFPTMLKFKTFVEEDCAQVYENIVPGNAVLWRAISLVIQAADQEDWIEDFIESALNSAPVNTQLLAWQARYRPAAWHPHGKAAAFAAAVELMDSANFDLDRIRQAIRDTLKSGSKVIGFSVAYPEAKFVEKLVNRLEYRLGVQSKPPVSLMPEIEPVADSIGQVRSHRADLDENSMTNPAPGGSPRCQAGRHRNLLGGRPR